MGSNSRTHPTGLTRVEKMVLPLFEIGSDSIYPSLAMIFAIHSDAFCKSSAS